MIPNYLIVILSIGTVLTLIFFILLFTSKEYNSFIAPLDSKEFVLKEVYPVGFKILDIIKYKYSSKGDNKLRQALGILYGKKYQEYYLRVVSAQRISLAFLALICSFPFYAIANDPAVLIIGAIFTWLPYYYFADEVQKKVKKRENEIIKDFPDVTAKLALLTNAGMIMREAWEKVAHTGEGVLYKEMLLTIDEISNGVAEVDAYYNFSMRCNCSEAKKFASALIQGLLKGNQELVLVLNQMNKESWEAKKYYVRQQGEKAASKLLIPICIMFIGILIMVIVPIFANLGV